MRPPRRHSNGVCNLIRRVLRRIRIEQYSGYTEDLPKDPLVRRDDRHPAILRFNERKTQTFRTGSAK